MLRFALPFTVFLLIHLVALGAQQGVAAATAAVTGQALPADPSADTAIVVAQAINLEGLKQLTRPDPGAECDRLAASDADPDRPSLVRGVSIVMLRQQLDAAIVACRAAVAAVPDERRLAFQLGRALQLGGQLVEARSWYEKASRAGSVVASNNLANMALNGQGGAKDAAEAVRLFRQAASAGLAIGMVNLARLLDAGNVVPRDYAEALSWLNKAAAAGNAEAMGLLGVHYADGAGVRPDAGVARDWFEKAAALGYPSAMFVLGEMYDRGTAVPQDYAQAKYWYEKAAAAGDDRAMLDLAFLHLAGRGVPLDNAIALDWYRRAAGAGNTAAPFYMGMMYLEGRGVPQRSDLAIDLIISSLALRDSQASDQLRDRPEIFTLEVRQAVQQFLIGKGVLRGIAADGNFGSETKAALDAWKASAQ